jgi:hypothetical protein
MAQVMRSQDCTSLALQLKLKLKLKSASGGITRTAPARQWSHAHSSALHPAYPAASPCATTILSICTTCSRYPGRERYHLCSTSQARLNIEVCQRSQIGEQSIYIREIARVILLLQRVLYESLRASWVLVTSSA